MVARAWRAFRAVHRVVVGGESWSSAWEAIKAELGEELPSLVGYVIAGVAMIGALIEDVSWTGVVVFTLGAFVAIRQLVIQQRPLKQEREPDAGGRPQARSVHVTGMSVSMKDTRESKTIAIYAKCSHEPGLSFKPCAQRGRIACAPNGSGLPPWLLERAPLVGTEATGEGMFTLFMTQRVPSTILDAIVEATGSESGVRFSLRLLEVFVTPDDAGESVSVPLWGGIDVRTLADQLVVTERQHVELASASPIRVGE
jgi:hypothetical protein